MGGNNSTPVVSSGLEEEKTAREEGSLPDLTVSGKTTLDFAITGMTGAGKSSLVNALRGLSDFEEEAAKTDVIEGTKEPEGYQLPAFPDVTIWDLPGIGTPDFKAEEYLERVNYSQYDFFIIVASNRFTVYDIHLSRALQKMKKRFYYVRSKMDDSIKSEKLNPEFNEEETLQRVRNDCLDNLVQAAGIFSPEIFLISSWYRDKYDFPLLQRTLVNEIKALRRRVLRPAVPPEAEDKRDDKATKPSKGSGISFFLLPKILKINLAMLRDSLMQKNLEEVTEEMHQELEALQNARLDIAITGVTGAGKSSLVNALRGMTDYEEGAAKVGITQTTMECQAYPHPLFPKVTVWDLPGIGTPEFRPEDYLKKVNFSQYDFFMIVASERFTENDVFLAHEIKKMKKKFYFVRSKMDSSIAAEMRNPNFKMDKSIQKIQKYCCDNLTEVGESNPRVFLITTRDLNMYDFPHLQEALENDLEDLKREALILALPVFSRKILEKKKAAMEGYIWKLALVSCAIGAIPVPGLSVFCDIGILVTGLILFYKVFGLDEDSLRRVANLVGKDYKMLKSAIRKSPMSGMITKEYLISILARSWLCTTVAVIEIISYFVPVLGSLVGGISSFATTFYMLRSFLNDIVEDAENVRAKAAEP
uniref:interferon-inducible GTPase 5-like n=1 Tax=Euleptes europaea TaxID=460621 RepID=UPI002540A97F|nr:interferon-inducible GTPase 5-like [Euleptes europaea]